MTAISTNSTGGSNQSEQLLVTIDTVAPSAPSVPELLLDSDSNIIGDGITDVNPPRFQGTAEANSTVSLINIFGEVIGVGTTGSDDSDGVTGNGLCAWQITVSPLSEGINLISADAEDLAGNIGPESSQSSIVIDTVIPQRPTITLISADDSGISNTDDITFVHTLHFVVTADPGTSVIVKDGNTVIDGPFIMPAGGSVVVPLTLSADGKYPLSVESTDTAGNINQSQQLLVTIDATPPPASTPVMLASSDSGVSNVDGITNVTAPAFEGLTEPNALITLYANGEAVGSATATPEGTWEITSEPLSDGVYQMSTISEDVAGNLSSTGIGASIEIDTAPPPTPLLDLQTQSDSGNAFDNVTYISPQDFTATVTDAVDPSRPVFWAVYDRDGTSPETLLASGGPTSAGVFPFVANLADGTHDLRLQVTDLAGNVSHDFLLDVTKIELSGQSSPGLATSLATTSTTATTPTIAQGILTTKLTNGYFKFKPTKSGTVNFDITTPGSGLISKLVILDSKLKTLGSNSGFNKGNGSHLSMKVTAGQTYYIQVTTAKKSTGFFELAVDYAPTNLTDTAGHTIKTAKQITLNSSGVGQTTGAIAVAGTIDVFRIAPSSTGMVGVSLSPVDGLLDPVLQVYDSTGKLINAAATKGGSSSDSKWVFKATKGQSYYIYVTGRGGHIGKYRLAIARA